MLAMHPFAPSMMDRMLVDTLDTFLAPTHFVTSALDRDVPYFRETEDGSYVLQLEAPGVSSDDMKVTVEAGVVKIEGKSQRDGYERTCNWSSSLPLDADADLATATVSDGLISISVPRKPKQEPIRIQVKQEPLSEEEAEKDDMSPDESEQDADAKEKHAYFYTIAAPGIAADDLKMVAEERLVSVCGKTKRPGFAPRHLAKIIRLPRDADTARTSASHIDGLLTIKVPKKSETAAKTLAINVADE